ncbi:KOW motif domain protein [Thermoascus aurantiacus ATCC 26904]
MQKVIRRTALARAQAQRKAAIAAKERQREEFKSALRERFAFNRMQLDLARKEREQRREDWMRGPLAPKRDSGLDEQAYATLLPQYLHPPKVPQHLRRKYINFAPGDRVCLMKGPDKGKIGEVIKVDPETETVTVQGLNMVDVQVPDWLSAQYGSKQPFHSVEAPIPMDDVRLVVALDDPATGQIREVLVKHVCGGEPILEREYGSTTPRHTRYIAGENIEIPWPKERPVQHKDEDWDTLRMEVETPTWMPSLLHPPFPPSVIDELRNKYSKYRTRHDPEFVEQKKLEDLKQEYLQSRTLLTPMGEFREMMRKKKEAKTRAKLDANGNVIMDEETKNFIERFMRQNAEKKNTNEASS